jgi:hypothetical protein
VQLGGDEPDFGVLLDDMEVPWGGSVLHGLLIAPRVAERRGTAPRQQGSPGALASARTRSDPVSIHGSAR